MKNISNMMILHGYWKMSGVILLRGTHYFRGIGEYQIEVISDVMDGISSYEYNVSDNGLVKWDLRKVIEAVNIMRKL